MGSSYNRSYFNNLNGLFFKDNQICLSIPMSDIDEEEAIDYFANDLNYIKREIEKVNSNLAYFNLSIEDNYHDGVSIVLNESRELFDEDNQKWEFDPITQKEFIDMFRNELTDDYNVVFKFIKDKIENGELEMYSESRGLGWSADSAISYDESINKLNEAKEHFEKMLSAIQLDVNKIKNFSITISDSDKYYIYLTSDQVNEVDRELIENVWIENGIGLISVYTFEDCTNLKSITIPDSVTEIGHDAFKNCVSLESIEIPNSVAIIGDSAFEDCENLKTIIIPDRVIRIKNATFYNCSSLESIKLPSNLKSIGKNAFAHCLNLKSITIPNNVTEIGAFAFFECKNLKSIEIPNWVTEIGGLAFGHCENLESIKLPSNLKSIGENAFASCTSLESIEIPNSVTEIGECAFYGCENLKSIEIPNSVEIIGDSAFEYCENLESIKLPSNLKSIGESAFCGCENLKSIIIPEKFKHRLEDFGIDESKVNVEFTKSNEKEM